MIKALIDRLIGQFFLEPLGLWFIVFPMLVGTGCISVNGTVPGLWTFLWQLPALTLLNEFLFYWAHRALHTPLLYGFAHKKHHEFKTPLSISSEYITATEGVFAGVLPIMLPTVVLPCHLSTFCVHVMIHILFECETHCGYYFPWSLSRWIPQWLGLGHAPHHDMHHLASVGNYGPTLVCFLVELKGYLFQTTGSPLFDALFGTTIATRKVRSE